MLYSVRMRSAKDRPHEKGGKHISGAERLLEEQAVDEAVRQMIRRARMHTRGKADFISIKIERIDRNKVEEIPALAFLDLQAGDLADGRRFAKQQLLTCGISKQAVDKAFSLLLDLKDNMRGAALLEAETGERLDAFHMRGVRVSRMDVKDEAGFACWIKKQGFEGLHVREAAVLAAKVAAAPGVIAELCWSDDPQYLTGYVAAQGVYHRITPLKSFGDERGGRVFFVRSGTELNKLVQYLQEQPVLVNWNLGKQGK